MRFKTLSTLLLLASFFILPSFSYAQEIQQVGPSDITNIINFIILPEVPNPNSPVTVSLESSGLDLDTAFITWSVNNKKIKSGQGLKKINLTNGPIGSKTTVSVDIDIKTEVVTRSITLSAGEVDLLWQGETYVPPFYKGRKLWTKQSQITLVAIPHIILSNGERIDIKSLIYRWTKDETVLGNSSGVGKNSLKLFDSILSLPQTIQVDILTDKNTVVASASINLVPQTVSVLIYEDNPLYGFLFNKEVGSNFILKSKEVSFVAFPFFFSVTNKNAPSLVYTWNNRSVVSETSNRVTFRAPDNTTGTSKISIGIQNENKILQTSTKNFIVKFGNLSTDETNQNNL